MELAPLFHEDEGVVASAWPHETLRIQATRSIGKGLSKAEGLAYPLLVTDSVQDVG